MATPAEKKALLFLGAIILLGGGVRLVRSASANAGDSASSAPAGPQPEPHRRSGAGEPRASSDEPESSSVKKKTRRRTKKSRSRPPPAEESPPAAPLDLDIASVADLDALGVLKPGVARMIIADREAFGPFGSIRGLERVPYLRKSAISALAPLVTFSRVPRPINAVFPARPDTAPSARDPSRKRSRARGAEGGETRRSPSLKQP